MRESEISHLARQDLHKRVYATMKSPVGVLTIVATDIGLSELWFDKPAANEVRKAIGDPSPRNPIVSETARQLRDYFAGTRTQFEIPLDIRGTEFQQRAWRGLLDIPYSETRSYAQHASAIGRPSAVRAVGAANGRNPVAIIIPCHRLVGSDGSLTGFGGGLDVKAWLLALERGERGAAVTRMRS